MDGKIFVNDGWLFAEVQDDSLVGKNTGEKMEAVRIPHTVTVTPFNAFSPKLYQKLSLYKKTFATEKSWSGKKVFVTVGAAAHFSKVYLNGKFLGDHRCGYTSFTFDLTENLLPEGQTNVLDIVVDSREDTDEMKDIPPFGNRIDYMTYGGIYREVFLEIKNPTHIEDIFVTTKKNQFSSTIKIAGLDGKK